MFSRVIDFGKRHRRKFLTVSALAGGLVLAGKFAEFKLNSWREAETRLYLERARRLHHFESTERTANLTLASLFKDLVEKIDECLDVNKILAEIKENPEVLFFSEFFPF